MLSVAFGKVEWSLAFPHRLAPHHDESLLGLLLRCDEANHWASGTTVTYLKRMSSTTKPIQFPHLVVPTPHQVELVAQWLALPVQTIRQMTYLTELARCYGLLHPKPADLGPSRTFRICPVCLIEQRLLKRTLVLLHVLYCPWHEITLLTHCQCGEALHPFHQMAPPFTCHVCGRDWADLPQSTPSPERIAVTRQLLSCYEFFLGQDDPTLPTKAFRAVFRAMEREILRHRRKFGSPSPGFPLGRKPVERKREVAKLESNQVERLGLLVFDLVRYHLYYDPTVVFWRTDGETCVEDGLGDQEQDDH